MKSALALMALGAAALPAAAIAQTSITIAETAPVVTLNVTESVEAAPDVATVGTGVQTRAQTAQAAMQQNAAQTEKLIAALAKAGCTVKEFEAEDGKIEAKCTDAQNKLWEVYIDPKSGKVTNVKNED